jgi:hypothetical protein
MKKLSNLSGIVLAIIIFAGLLLLIWIGLNTNHGLQNVATSADINRVAISIDNLASCLRPNVSVPALAPIANKKDTSVSFNGNYLVIKNMKSCRGSIIVKWNYCNTPYNRHVYKPAKKVKKSAKTVALFTPNWTTPAPAPVTAKIESYQNTLNLSDYSPKMVGDYGTTFTMAGHPIYFLSAPYYKKLGYTIPPKWNGKYPMVLNNNGSYWIYEDSSVVLDYSSMVNKTWIWCVWVGQRTSGASTYDMYLPHESIKPLLQAYLGREYGKISSDDLKILSRYSPGIANGSIMPNDIVENNALGYKDSHVYEGWEFCTKTQYIYHGTTTSSVK